VKAIKSDSDSDSDEQKRLPGFTEKHRGVTPSVAAPGVTHPSDTTEQTCSTVHVSRQPAAYYIHDRSNKSSTLSAFSSSELLHLLQSTNHRVFDT